MAVSDILAPFLIILGLLTAIAVVAVGKKLIVKFVAEITACHFCDNTFSIHLKVWSAKFVFYFDHKT